MPVPSIVLLVFSVFMLLGGAVGFLVSKSKASLIMGALSSLGIILCVQLSINNPQQGLSIAAGIIAVLIMVFFRRMAKTQKFMPSGMLFGVSCLTFIYLLKELFF
ncbi:MAG: TMEM14 family protein [Candidatus Omnitrophica bacterium]|nr:TMEM14 family protein [Candidatus Omnitrophota bacterium]